ncbi:iron-containing alcohol dehydrogenase [Pyramidobacter porci]
MSNPTYAKVQEDARLAREKKVDFILAVGGGSVSDCCKIVSAQAGLNEDIWEFEYAKRRRPTEFIPMGVVTVGGTGSEQNNGAVITHEAKKIKSALWGASADFAVLDPAYTMSAPLTQAVSGAFDTLSHCMETYFGQPHDDNLSDDLSEAVMRSVIRNARRLVRDRAICRSAVSCSGPPPWARTACSRPARPRTFRPIRSNISWALIQTATTAWDWR